MNDQLSIPEDFSETEVGTIKDLVSAVKKLPPISQPGDIECQRCGKCCSRFIIDRGLDIHDLDREWNADDTILIKELRELFVEVDTTLCDYHEDGKIHWYRCNKLHIDPETSKAECLIHDSRPELCRIFAPGNYSCPADYPCAKIKAARQQKEIK